MSWDKTFNQMFGSQNSHNPQKWGKRGVFEDIENKSLNISKSVFNPYMFPKNKKDIYTKIHSQNPQKESGAKCLGGDCGLAGYQFEAGTDRLKCEVLWCGRADSAVIDLDRCPDKKWAKDSQGRPISKRRL